MNATAAFKSGAFLGMAFGAFGSHGLRARSPPLPERSHSSLATAASYMIYNGLGLMVVSYHPGLVAGIRRYRIATGMILGGGLVFSGTIFALVLARDKVGKVLGPTTPLGGAVMMAGYLALVF